MCRLGIEFKEAMLQQSPLWISLSQHIASENRVKNLESRHLEAIPTLPRVDVHIGMLSTCVHEFFGKRTY